MKQKLSRRKVTKLRKILRTLPQIEARPDFDSTLKRRISKSTKSKQIRRN